MISEYGSVPRPRHHVERPSAEEDVAQRPVDGRAVPAAFLRFLPTHLALSAAWRAGRLSGGVGGRGTYVRIQFKIK